MGSPRIKVLAKAARLVEELAFPDSTPASLAQRLHEPRPTVYRLIQDLALLGCLDEGPATWWRGPTATPGCWPAPAARVRAPNIFKDRHLTGGSTKREKEGRRF